MTETVKKQSSWMQALKQFNSTRDKWLLPKKDTPEYAEVLKIKDSLKTPPTTPNEPTPSEQVEPIEKKKRKPRTKREGSANTL